MDRRFKFVDHIIWHNTIIVSITKGKIGRGWPRDTNVRNIKKKLALLIYEIVFKKLVEKQRIVKALK